MTTQAVLLYGAGGWIGGLMTSVIGAEGLQCVPAQSRADAPDGVRAELERVRPRLVFAAIGCTHGVHAGTAFDTIDYLEQPGRLRENVRDNLIAPLVLAAICREARVPFVSIATGCIFDAAELDIWDGAAQPGFDDDAPANFFASSYSTVKGATDALLRLLFAESALWFRIRMPVTHDLHPRSFLSKITRYERVCSMPNSMSVLDGDGGLLALFLKMGLAGYTGCFNGCNPGVLSHNDILASYRDIVDAGFQWRNFTIAEQNEILAAGRSNNRLDHRKLQAAASALDFPLPTLEAAMASVLHRVKERSAPCHSFVK